MKEITMKMSCLSSAAEASIGSYEIESLPEQHHLPRVDLRAHLETDEVDAALLLVRIHLDNARDRPLIITCFYISQ